jgi:hypothetical protein
MILGSRITIKHLANHGHVPSYPQGGAAPHHYPSCILLYPSHNNFYYLRLFHSAKQCLSPRTTLSSSCSLKSSFPGTSKASYRPSSTCVKYFGIPSFPPSFPYPFSDAIMRPPAPTADSSIGLDRLHARSSLRALRAHASS